MELKTHTEIIQCPECGSTETATVEHSWPWWTYIHHCGQCEYVIMESEWQLVPLGVLKARVLISRMLLAVCGTHWYKNRPNKPPQWVPRSKQTRRRKRYFIITQSVRSRYYFEHGKYSDFHFSPHRDIDPDDIFQ